MYTCNMQFSSRTRSHNNIHADADADAVSWCEFIVCNYCVLLDILKLTNYLLYYSWCSIR